VTLDLRVMLAQKHPLRVMVDGKEMLLVVTVVEVEHPTAGKPGKLTVIGETHPLGAK
jgi:hypothetical protein